LELESLYPTLNIWQRNAPNQLQRPELRIRLSDFDGLQHLLLNSGGLDPMHGDIISSLGHPAGEPYFQFHPPEQLPIECAEKLQVYLWMAHPEHSTKY